MSRWMVVDVVVFFFGAVAGGSGEYGIFTVWSTPHNHNRCGTVLTDLYQ